VSRKLKSWNFKRIEHSNSKVAVVTTEGSNTYYHWLFDILPRIFLLEKSGLMDEIESFVFPELKFNFQRESLLKIGFPMNKILEIKPNEYLEAKEIIVPSLPSKLGTVNPWALDFLRNRLGGISSTNERNKIYISRKKTNQRKLLNEDEIINFLKDEGYLIVFAEELSFEQQITLFSNSDVVISPHGSGLSNIVFCPPNTKVIELFYGDFIVPCFWLMAKQLNLKYYGGFSREPENHISPYWKSNGINDKFPITVLAQLLKEANK
jgi:capsular polysaccharide biosynthesis protein